ncbi:hypothetical protein CC86DRAFT_453654 [Ophiobolus disseminans]|uniref:GmrSD restriction endonucleases N-terminal domain-containing protein n=1 Tax=Ophiobolus disseminans TaxID=1469910 RepID=A0A6A7ABT9_9PLEO|nr:hypothetical protein CC86DRAFT_453654 [Ophiobolus disseminans]
MPGCAMDHSQASAITTKRSTAASRGTLQPFIKDENENTLGDNDYDEDTYRPRPQLPKPFVVMRSLAHLIRDLDTGLIDVDPEYQREVVWTADRMTGLINSLMENFYIPPIILNKKALSKQSPDMPSTIHVCVDGKQRLSSVRAFVKGMIPCLDHRGEKWFFCETPISRRKKVLSEDAQKKFLAKEFVSFEFKDLSQEQEEDLFARVQMGVQLSLAEKMRASTGPWQELARLFVEDFPIVYSLMKDRARAKDFQLTLSCFSQIVEVMHPTAADGIPILKTGHTSLPKLLNNKGAVDDGIKSHLASVWSTFKDLVEQDSNTFTNANKYLRGVQTFAPVEMVGVTVLISMYAETRNQQLLLGDIRGMREAIREHFVDIRTNNSLWKFIWEYLEDLETTRGAVDGSTVTRGIVQPAKPSASDTDSAARSPTSPAPKVGAKRARPTAKTKPSSILPPQLPFTIKKEEGTPKSTEGPSQPKRRRTDPSPLSPPASDVERATSGTFSTALSLNQFISPPPRLSEFVAAQPQYPPRSTHAMATSVASPRSSVPPQPLPTATAVHTNAATVPRQMKSPVSKRPCNSPHASVQTVPLPAGLSSRTPSSAPPISAAALQSHGLGQIISPSRHALMASSVSVAPMQQLPPANNLSNSGSDGTASTMPSVHASSQGRRNHGSPALRAGLGAFAPRYTEQQWAGEVRSASPQSMPTSTAPPSKPQPVRKPVKARQRPTPAQYDGAIDLTSDDEHDLPKNVEQERLDLLSAFKAKALAAKQAQTQSAPTITTTAAAQELTLGAPRGSALKPRNAAQNITVRENNPYARYKRAGHPGPSGA